MRIGIDVRMIQNFPTGIGNYRENLIGALAKLCRDGAGPVSTKFILIGNVGNKTEMWAKSQPQFEFVAIKSKPNSVHQHFLLPFELASLKLDLFWTTPWGASIFLTDRYALTIYDLLYRRYPEIASLKARLYEGLVSKWVAHRAEIIFTTSEFVKNDIEEFLGIKKDKIVKIQGAASESFKMLKDQHLQGLALQTLRRHGISKPFFVYLGNFRPHKNLRTLLEAFANLKSQSASGGSNLKLVLIGSVDAKGRDRDSENLLKLIKELNLQNDVIPTGRIADDREVAAILNEAIALVHPSFHEGFGLTVLEAMSCGCPVIAAKTSSIPEVGGNAVIYVDPFDATDIASAMGKVLNYFHTLEYGKKYQSLVQRGLEQARKFSWEKTAKKVLENFQ